jgi:hypothetical protein
MANWSANFFGKKSKIDPIYPFFYANIVIGATTLNFRDSSNGGTGNGQRCRNGMDEGRKRRELNGRTLPPELHAQLVFDGN